MGGCQCKQDFRFKRLVDGAYPSAKTEIEGDMNAGGASKLAAYVDHNEESVPRVCRQIRKRLDEDLEYAPARIKRASVSAQLLRTLVRAAAPSALEFYVPFTVDAAATLLARSEPELNVAGCDLLSAVAFQIEHHARRGTNAGTNGGPPIHPGPGADDSSQAASARRLYADKVVSTMRALDHVIHRASDGLGTQRIDAIHCRYAAIVCIGNASAAMGSLLADRGEAMARPVLLALQEACKSGFVGGSSNAADACNPLAAGSAMAEACAAALLPIDSCVLPVDPVAKDRAYRAACIRALAGIAPSSATTLATTLDSIFTHIATNNGWRNPAFASTVTIVCALSVERRHQSGYSVCQQLARRLEADVRAADEVACVLRCITIAARVVPLSASRPVTLFAPVFRYVSASPSKTAPEVSAAARDAVVAVVARAFAQRNISAAARILTAISRHIRSTAEAYAAEAFAAEAANEAPPLAASSSGAAAKLELEAPSRSSGLAASDSLLQPKSSPAPTSAGTAANTTSQARITRIDGALRVMARLAPIASLLPSGERRDSGVAAAAIAVLSDIPTSKLDGEYAVLAGSIVTGYIARPADVLDALARAAADVVVDGGSEATDTSARVFGDAKSHAPASLGTSDRVLFHDWARTTLLYRDAWKAPAKLLLAVDVAGALLTVAGGGGTSTSSGAAKAGAAASAAAMATPVCSMLELAFAMQHAAISGPSGGGHRDPMDMSLDGSATSDSGTPPLDSAGLLRSAFDRADADALPRIGTRTVCVAVAGLLAQLARHLRNPGLSAAARKLARRNAVKPYIEPRVSSSSSSHQGAGDEDDNDDDEAAAQPCGNKNKSRRGKKFRGAGSPAGASPYMAGGTVRLPDVNVRFPEGVPDHDDIAEATPCDRRAIARLVVQHARSLAAVQAELPHGVPAGRVLAVLEGAVRIDDACEKDADSNDEGSAAAIRRRRAAGEDEGAAPDDDELSTDASFAHPVAGTGSGHRGASSNAKAGSKGGGAGQAGTTVALPSLVRALTAAATGGVRHVVFAHLGADAPSDAQAYSPREQPVFDGSFSAGDDEDDTDAACDAFDAWLAREDAAAAAMPTWDGAALQTEQPATPRRCGNEAEDLVPTMPPAGSEL